MNKTQEVLRKHVLEKTASKMAEAVKEREKAANVPLPELPEDIYKPSWWRMFSFDVGFSPQNVRTVFTLMTGAGWRCTDEADDIVADLKTGESASATTLWHHDDFKGVFWIEFMIGSEGSNCKRVKIGTKTVEEDIYEVICDEGAEEALDASN